MERIYYPDHDKRYAHINPRERWKYPDEIHIGPFVIKRTKPLSELTGRDLQGHDSALVAKDVPFTKGCCRC